MLHSLLMVIDVFCAVGIIALVLVQRGKGADAGAGFGAGASGTVFGARGAGTALSRATAILAAVFMLASLALAYTSQRAAAPASILDDIPEQEVPVAPAAPAASEIPVAPAPSPAPAQ
ncbi:preprotein translocase subunit SecG [bacterium]|nr:MAG: preprotein translocase subunit SecG [bacterium]